MAWKMTYWIWIIFLWAVKSLEICRLMGSFCLKHIKIKMKKYRRDMSHDTEEWCEVWRKTDSFGSKNVIQNLHSVWHFIQKVHFNASTGNSKNLHFHVVLLLSISYEVSAKKSTEGLGLSLMTLKKDLNFGEKLIFCFKKMTCWIWRTLSKQWKFWKFALWWATFVESV